MQLYHIGDPLVECHLLEPDDQLKLGIYYFWHINIAPGPVNLAVIPDNAIDLVMSPDLADFSALYFPVVEKFSIPAGIAAAMASGEYHVRNMRSTKCCMDQVAVLRIKGIATTRTSRYPPSLLHRFFRCCICCCLYHRYRYR